MFKLTATGPTVLVVDDDDDVRVIAAVVVAELGCRVLEANSGAAALEILHGSEAVDVLLTDVAMPRMGGAELALLAKQARPNLKVVYTSAYVHMSEKDPSLRFGPLIEKPWMREQLAKVLEALFASPVPTGPVAQAALPTDTKLALDPLTC